MNFGGLNKTTHKFLRSFFSNSFTASPASLHFKYPYFLRDPLPGFSSCLVPSTRLSHLPFFTFLGLPSLYSLTSHPTSRPIFAASFSIFYSVTYYNSPFQELNSPSSSTDLLPHSIPYFRNWNHLSPESPA